MALFEVNESELVLRRQKESSAVIAIGLLTQKDLEILGSSFRSAIPLTIPGEFDDLLARIDEAERKAAAEAAR